MASPTTENTQFVFGHVVIMLVVNCVLYMLVALYLEQVAPGPFGSPRPWYFPFQPRFWCPGGKSGDYFFLKQLTIAYNLPISHFYCKILQS